MSAKNSEKPTPAIRVPLGGLKYQLPIADQVIESEMEIKRSRFLTYITRVQSEDEARDFITLVREMFPDARHHCSAYIYHVDDANDVERSSDDGEPSGTAGKPMLEALRGSGMKDIAAVVVRYFGGIKLGTGGLVNAYTNAVTSTLSDVPAPTDQSVICSQFTFPTMMPAVSKPTCAAWAWSSPIRTTALMCSSPWPWNPGIRHGWNPS